MAAIPCTEIRRKPVLRASIASTTPRLPTRPRPAGGRALEHGRGTELGTPDGRRARGGRYQTMFDLQAQRFNPAEDEEGRRYDVLA